uniref:Uncharacterized protein n=1 Tax=Amphiprion ocellaris TaxID=80972 RepID=A0AAQ6A199_AMPOC
MQSQVRQNYHSDCTAAIDQMVNMEMVDPDTTGHSHRSHVCPLTAILGSTQN